MFTKCQVVAMQDVGLLFCSNMAASIAAIGLAAGASTPEIMGTALTWLAISTIFVGICTMLVGHYKLATLVQYMPLPVVGACAAAQACHLAQTACSNRLTCLFESQILPMLVSSALPRA